MSSPSSPRDQLIALATRLDLPLDELMADFASLSLAPPTEEPVRHELPLSDTTIRAAICDSYSASEIHDPEIERDLLSQSDVVMVGGRRRLRLGDEARRAILRSARGDDRFARLLGEAVEKDRGRRTRVDEVEAPSIWLRRFLHEDATPLESASPAELRAAVAGRERLGDAAGPNVPSLDRVKQLLEHADLLEPLRISIGAEGPWNSVPDKDRFVGRDSERATLRKYVDEIESHSRLESVQRGFAKAGQTIQRSFGDERVPGTRLIVARGGLGKSALIAKFVLDHALLQRRRFPFAYLDFDRAALQPREPRLLLLELSRQVGLQFPEVEMEMARLRESIRTAINMSDTTRDPFDEFRDLVRERITFDERALLVVLDTMEIVQADNTALKGVVDFVERLSQKGFTELRVVAAGRADIPELVEKTPFRHSGTTLTLEPLSHKEAQEMAGRLGESLLGEAWKSEWSKRVAGKTSDAAPRREPLSLRVAVEAIRDEADPQAREKLSLEIEELGEEADASFVGKLYQRRVLEHVQDSRVRKIAWPGLVVRRVTVEIIRDLLAKPCGLDPSDAATVFNALASQVWIVARDGDVLRHHPDLRARTLPLMRRFDPEDATAQASKTAKREAARNTGGAPRFLKINAEAVAYFGSRKDSSPSNRAEWLYHRLLGGESPDRVDSDWSDSLAPFLKDAHEDFPAASASADYLAARTADRLLPDDVLRRLNPRLALLHLARVAPQKGSLSDRTLDPVLAALPLSGAAARELSGPVPGALQCLLVKTGRWAVAGGVDAPLVGPWEHRAATAIAFRRARTSAAENRAAVLNELAAPYRYSAVFERAPLGAVIQDLAVSRILDLPTARQIDELLARRFLRGDASTDPSVGVPELRTAMTFGDKALVPAARFWTAQLTERLHADEQFACSAHELLPFERDKELVSVTGSVLKEYDLEWSDFVAIHKDADERTRLESPMLGLALRDAVVRRYEGGTSEDIRALRRFAAARDEDWIVPMAYAAFRALDEKVPKELGELFESHQPVSRGYLRRNVLSRTTVTGDFVEALRRADEASDLAGAARLFVKHAERETGQDLGALVQHYTAWRRNVDRLVDPPQALTFLA